MITQKAPLVGELYYLSIFALIQAAITVTAGVQTKEPDLPEQA